MRQSPCCVQFLLYPPILGHVCSQDSHASTGFLAHFSCKPSFQHGVVSRCSRHEEGVWGGSSALASPPSALLCMLCFAQCIVLWATMTADPGVQDKTTKIQHWLKGAPCHSLLLAWWLLTPAQANPRPHSTQPTK